MTFLGIFIAGCWGGFTLGILFAGAAAIRSHRAGNSPALSEANGYASSGVFAAAISGEPGQSKQAGIAF